MTLVALNWNNNTFTALWDSRISEEREKGAFRKIIDRYPMVIITGYRFTVGDALKPTSIFEGQLGFAFAGSLLMAIALRSLCDRLLTNFHSSSEETKAPALLELSECVRRVAELLHEDTLVAPREYEALLFGFCPRTSAPAIYHLHLDRSG